MNIAPFFYPVSQKTGIIDFLLHCVNLILASGAAREAIVSSE